MRQVRAGRQHEAVEKIKQLVRSASICMFSTSIVQWPLHARAVNTQDVDDEGNIWFIENNTDRNEAIDANPKVQLFYSNASKSEFLSLTGTATVTYEYQKTEKVGTPVSKAGKENPQMSFIKIKPEEAYYWDSTSNQMVPIVVDGNLELFG